MWDFLIVLGQIPGTSIQITFNELITFLVFAFLLVYAYKKYSLGAWLTIQYRLRKLDYITVKRSAKRRQKTSGKWLTAFKKKAGAKLKLPRVRGIPSAKVHSRQRIA